MHQQHQTFGAHQPRPTFRQPQDNQLVPRNSGQPWQPQQPPVYQPPAYQQPQAPMYQQPPMMIDAWGRAVQPPPGYSQQQPPMYPQQGYNQPQPMYPQQPPMYQQPQPPAYQQPPQQPPMYQQPTSNGNPQVYQPPQDGMITPQPTPTMPNQQMSPTMQLLEALQVPLGNLNGYVGMLPEELVALLWCVIDQVNPNDQGEDKDAGLRLAQILNYIAAIALSNTDGVTERAFPSWTPPAMSIAERLHLTRAAGTAQATCDQFYGGLYGHVISPKELISASHWVHLADKQGAGKMVRSALTAMKIDFSAPVEQATPVVTPSTSVKPMAPPSAFDDELLSTFMTPTVIKGEGTVLAGIPVCSGAHTTDARVLELRTDNNAHVGVISKYKADMAGWGKDPNANINVGVELTKNMLAKLSQGLSVRLASVIMSVYNEIIGAIHSDFQFKATVDDIDLSVEYEVDGARKLLSALAASLTVTPTSVTYSELRGSMIIPMKSSECFKSGRTIHDIHEPVRFILNPATHGSMLNVMATAETLQGRRTRVWELVFTDGIGRLSVSKSNDVYYAMVMNTSPLL